MPFAISPPEAARLEALADSPSIAAYAKANNLSLTNLALWLQRPDIAEAHEALLQLKALDRRTWQDEVTKEAIETLRETMKASEDPIERRRCANTILRALARSNRPARPSSRDADSGPLARPARENGRRERAGERASSSTPSSASTSDHSVSSSLSLSVSGGPSVSDPPPYDYEGWAAKDQARQEALRTNPTHPEVLDAIDANKAAPTPEDFAKTPESCTDLAASRLAATPNPTGHRLFLAIYDALDIDLRMNAKTWDPCKRTLEASPFATCKEADGWTTTAHPVEHQQHAGTATRKYTFTNETTGETKACTLALSHRAPHFPDPTHWWITHILTPNTS